jgi:hypothetical protein
MSSNPRKSRALARPRKTREARSRKRTAEGWEGLLALVERSGLSEKRFCHDNAVALSTLQYRLREARRGGRGRRDGALMEVHANAASPESPGRAASPLPGSVDMRLPNRVELSVLAGTDSACVGALLRGLLTCSRWRAPQLLLLNPPPNLY